MRIRLRPIALDSAWFLQSLSYQVCLREITKRAKKARNVRTQFQLCFCKCNLCRLRRGLTPKLVRSEAGPLYELNPVDQ